MSTCSASSATFLRPSWRATVQVKQLFFGRNKEVFKKVKGRSRLEPCDCSYYPERPKVFVNCSGKSLVTFPPFVPLVKDAKEVSPYPRVCWQVPSLISRVAPWKGLAVPGGQQLEVGLEPRDPGPQRLDPLPLGLVAQSHFQNGQGGPAGQPRRPVFGRQQPGRTGRRLLESHQVGVAVHGATLDSFSTRDRI